MTGIVESISEMAAGLIDSQTVVSVRGAGSITFSGLRLQAGTGRPPLTVDPGPPATITCHQPAAVDWQHGPGGKPLSVTLTSRGAAFQHGTPYRITLFPHSTLKVAGHPPVPLLRALPLLTAPFGEPVAVTDILAALARDARAAKS